MTYLQALPEPDYCGRAGVAHVLELCRALVSASEQGDWAQVQRLDRLCSPLVDRVVAASDPDDSVALTEALMQLRAIYRDLLTATAQPRSHCAVS